jgi:putative ABC transport system ATP-binding protein
MLQCQNLYKTFHPDNNPLNDKKALQGVSLTIHDGDFIAVIGGNGSGKTTSSIASPASTGLIEAA